jgi:serine/threonine-protein kinase
MQSEDGNLKLSDFGIASFGSQVAEGDEGVILGTPGYLSPESFNDNAYDDRTDLFALGVTLVELLTGKRPFVGKDIRQIMTVTVKQEVVLPESLVTQMPAEMVKFIDSLLAKRVKARCQSAEQALQALATFQQDIEAGSGLETKQLNTATEGESGGSDATIEVGLDELPGTQPIERP